MNRDEDYADLVPDMGQEDLEENGDGLEVVEELGADAFVYGKPADSSIKFAHETDEGAQVIVRWDPKNPPKPGETISVSAIQNAIHLFDSASGLRINKG